MDSEMNGSAARRGEGRSGHEVVVSHVGRARDGKSRDDRLYELAARITERDRAICRLLHEHRVLTTSQLTAVAFSSLRKAQERLSLLYGLE